MTTPYYEDDQVALFLGDMREVLPVLNPQADCIVTDPPYAETSLTWDQWPDGWPTIAATITPSMWCFGSMRMFLDRRDDFTGWQMSQDIVWEKNNGSGFARDRFRRVHEHITHWYRGPWRDIYTDVPRTTYSGPDKSARGRNSHTPHTGQIGAHTYVDDGTRLARSVIRAGAVRYQRRHPTEKPVELLDLLIRYACPPGGLVVDLFAGSGSTLDAARRAGRRAVGIEADERYAEAAARRLAEPYSVDLFSDIA